MPGIDKACQGEGATHHSACDCREKYFAAIEKTLEFILFRDQSRGYPTPVEWRDLVNKVRAALKGE